MVTHDRSRIKDSGSYNWSDKFFVPRLSAYESEAEPSAHARHRLHYYALSRVELTYEGAVIELMGDLRWRNFKWFHFRKGTRLVLTSLITSQREMMVVLVSILSQDVW